MDSYRTLEEGASRYFLAIQQCERLEERKDFGIYPQRFQCVHHEAFVNDVRRGVERSRGLPEP